MKEQGKRLPDLTAGLTKPHCRHVGGKDDCDPACMLLWGESFMAVPPLPPILPRYIVICGPEGSRVPVDNLPYIDLPPGTTRIYLDYRKTCRHYGSEEDCTPACMRVWGGRYIEIPPPRRHNAHRPIKQRSEDFCYGRHCNGQIKR